MFDSIGIGELGVILVLTVVFVEPKQVGRFLRKFNDIKRKLDRIQNEVKRELNNLVDEDDAAKRQASLQGGKAEMRKWARERVRALPAAEREEAARAMARKLADWGAYREAKVLSCFYGAADEVDTDAILRQALADGKVLLMPWIEAPAANGDPKATKTMRMAVVEDLARDLAEGEFRLLEPVDGARARPAPPPDLILVPGLCFDAYGGRVGKGLGFYDRYLAEAPGLKVGLAFDVQITANKLALEPHDRTMDHILTEKRFITLSQPRNA